MAQLPTRLAPEVEEAHALLVKTLHGTILNSVNNVPAKQQSAVETLTTLVQNMLREPQNDKFRRVRATNETFKARLLSVKGGEEFLKALGFRDQTADFTRFLVLADSHFNEEILGIAERLLLKCQRAVEEKNERQRHERETWLAKNEAKLRREAALVAIAEDKARREERLAREAETRALVGRVPRPPLPPSGLEARSPPSAPGAAAEEDS